MSIIKQTKDRMIRYALGKNSVPAGLSALNRYFGIYEPINFKNEKQSDGSIIAISQNFQYGTIITQANNKAELDEKIKDAILTTFEVPSSYAKEAGIHKVGDEKYAYA